MVEVMVKMVSEIFLVTYLVEVWTLDILRVPDHRVLSATWSKRAPTIFPVRNTWPSDRHVENDDFSPRPPDVFIIALARTFFSPLVQSGLYLNRTGRHAFGMLYLHFRTFFFHFSFFFFRFFPVYVNFHGIVNQCALIRSRVYNIIIEEERTCLTAVRALYIYIYVKRIPKWFHYKKRNSVILVNYQCYANSGTILYHIIGYGY